MTSQGDFLGADEELEQERDTKKRKALLAAYKTTTPRPIFVVDFPEFDYVPPSARQPEIPSTTAVGQSTPEKNPRAIKLVTVSGDRKRTPSPILGSSRARPVDSSPQDDNKNSSGKITSLSASTPESSAKKQSLEKRSGEISGKSDEDSTLKKLASTVTPRIEPRKIPEEHTQGTSEKNSSLLIYVKFSRTNFLQLFHLRTPEI